MDVPGQDLLQGLFVRDPEKKKDNFVKLPIDILWKQQNSKQQFFTVLPEIRNIVLGPN